VGFSSRESVNEYLKVSSSTPFNIPVYLFIDKKGIIRAQYTGGGPFFEDEDKNTRAMIDMLMKEPAQTRQGAKKGPAPPVR
jgi:hypothetical protein